MNLQPLPIGTSDFSALRSAGQTYVDKTEFVYELASERQKYFLARPRRFGKSLLISTFETLFRDGLKNFEGLKIEKLWKEVKTYSVVRLDFSRLKSTDTEDFDSLLAEYLSHRFSAVGFTESARGGSILNQLEAFLKKLPDSSLVVLIDEYDAPLTTVINDQFGFARVREALSAFYALLKSNDRVIRFLFLTGIITFNKLSIFSELNNLNDISLSPRYGSLLGYALGVYGTLYTGNSPDDGFYVDSWLLFGHYNNKLWSEDLANFRYKSNGWVWSVESGYTIPLSQSGSKDFNKLIWTFQPEIQLVWDGVKADTTVDKDTETRFKQL